MQHTCQLENTFSKLALIEQFPVQKVLLLILIITLGVQQLLLFLYEREALSSLEKLSGFVQVETGRIEIDFYFPKSLAVFFKFCIKFF